MGWDGWGGMAGRIKGWVGGRTEWMDGWAGLGWDRAIGLEFFLSWEEEEKGGRRRSKRRRYCVVLLVDLL